MDKDTQNQTSQHFKFTLPILKTRTAVVKDAEGKEIEKRYVQGVASSTDLDLHGDRMDPSAIKTMAESLRHHVIRLNAEHDTTWQSELGDISKLDVTDDYKLLVEAELNDMSKSHDLWYALTELNKKLGLSIGGYVKEYEMVKEEFKNEETGEMDTRWVRHYKNIELDHIAVTSSPANPKTWVGAIAKSIQESSETLIKKIEAEETENPFEISKPYPNEHACRLRDPNDFKDGSFRSTERDHNGKKYRVIMGRLKGKNTMSEQAYRYNKGTWSTNEAKNHCISHKGSFEAAQKSTKVKEVRSEKEKKLREIARSIVRAIQNLEADLLLELTFVGLNILSESQIKLLDTLLVKLDTLSIKGSKPMDKNISLEAEEAKKADTAVQPENETVEIPATPENESKEETPKAEETKAKEPKDETSKANEAEVTKEGDAEETPTAPSEEDKPEEAPVEEPTSAEPTEEEPKAEEGKSEESSGDEESDKDDEEKGEGEAELSTPSEGEAEKSDETKSEDKVEDKSAEQQTELLKAVQSLTDSMKKILDTNETLIKRVAELEKQPATRKTVELEKGIGDEEVDSTDAKTLKQEMEEKIAQVRKDNYGNPNLFAMIQKIRADYSKKIKGQ